MGENIKKYTYKIKGMHCSACEILIERKLLKNTNIKKAYASTPNNEVQIEYTGQKPSFKDLNTLFKSEGYTFFDEEKYLSNDKSKQKTIFFVVIGLVVIGAIYLLLDKLGLTALISVNPGSSLVSFFLFGIVAGLSSCAALVGGIVLSMSKQWYELYSSSDSFIQKSQPHLLFNLGRLISFLLLGGLLGTLGSIFSLSPLFNSILVILVSILMILLGLQMLGIKAFQKFQITTPKFVSRYISNESNFRGKYMPFVMGALTFFLPCGFTLTAQSLAIVSGSFINGALIMFFFALGTSPMLLLLGLSSTKLYGNTNLSKSILILIAILVILFGVINIKRQMVVLGLPI